MPMSSNSDQYYRNKTSMPAMKNVLVLTMPDTRNYTITKKTEDRNETVRSCDIFLNVLALCFLNLFLFFCLFNLFIITLYT